MTIPLSRPALFLLLAYLLGPVSAAWSADLALRRSTTIPLTPIHCSEQGATSELQSSRVLVQRIALRIMKANSDLFQGDLAPHRICVVADAATGQRAWAEPEKRLIRIEAGMLLRVQNEAQLAFVIAHELAHLALRHTPLEGNPISKESKGEADALLIERTRLFNELIRTPKGTPELFTLQRNLAEVQQRLQTLFTQHFDAETAANWLETEAEDAGAYYYLKAGYPASEMGWRLEQLVVAIHRAGMDPRYQNSGPSFNPHAAPGRETLSERNQMALAVCNLSSNPSDLPTRGNQRYARPCWQLWNLRFQLPEIHSQFGQLYETARIRSQDTLKSPDLRTAQQNLCASAATRLEIYCQ